ncbi:hypothetical protein NDU88_006660 [Pleurodeles waltl]|uniref:Uncharacterized protein n=1 Tax=Pleurodeles waltl TaxID=8319 RepID=A0AAV7M0R9_PLEWA|nr:hypothetical protein NDU88_006660 [Pleurodeles waltl]
MVRNKGRSLLQAMDKSAVLKHAGGTVVPDNAEGGQEKDQGPVDKPSLSAIMAAIQDLCGSLEPKLDTVTVDVNLLRTDLKKVTEKVTNAETDIARLQSTSKRLEDLDFCFVLLTSATTHTIKSLHAHEPLSVKFDKSDLSFTVDFTVRKDDLGSGTCSG